MTHFSEHKRNYTVSCAQCSHSVAPRQGAARSAKVSGAVAAQLEWPHGGRSAAVNILGLFMIAAYMTGCGALGIATPVSKDRMVAMQMKLLDPDGKPVIDKKTGKKEVYGVVFLTQNCNDKIGLKPLQDIAMQMPDGQIIVMKGLGEKIWNYMIKTGAAGANIMIPFAALFGGNENNQVVKVITNKDDHRHKHKPKPPGCGIGDRSKTETDSFKYAP